MSKASRKERRKIAAAPANPTLPHPHPAAAPVTTAHSADTRPTAFYSPAAINGLIAEADQLINESLSQATAPVGFPSPSSASSPIPETPPPKRQRSRQDRPRQCPTCPVVPGPRQPRVSKPPRRTRSSTASPPPPSRTSSSSPAKRNRRFCPT